MNYTTQKPCYYVYTYDKHFKKEGRIYRNVTYHEVFFNNVFFVRNILEIFGSTKNWRINVDKFLSYGNDFCIGFIRGMFDSEGSFWIQKGKNLNKGTISFSSTNLEGAKEFYELLNRLGYEFRFYLNERKNGGIEVSIRTCKLSIVNKFFQEIGFSIDRKQEKLANFIKLRNF